jgi:hypothetical protein
MGRIIGGQDMGNWEKGDGSKENNERCGRWLTFVSREAQHRAGVSVSRHGHDYLEEVCPHRSGLSIVIL